VSDEKLWDESPTSRHLKVNTNHMKAKLFQPRIPSWHRDK